MDELHDSNRQPPRDETARQSDGEMPNENEHIFRLLVDGIRDYAIFLLDPEGHVVTWNAGAERIKGYRATEIIGQHFSRFYPAEDVAEGKPQRALEQARSQGRTEDEGWRIRADGTRFWANVVITPLRDPSGGLRGFSKITRDMTDRKRQQDTLESVVDHVIDGIITIDRRGIVHSFNPAAERLFGYQAAEVIGQNVKLLMPEPYRREHDRYLTNYLETGQAKIIGIGREVVGRRKDGSTFPMDLAVSEFSLSGQRFFTGIVRDVTERKQLEQALRQQMEELAEAEQRIRSVVDHVIDGIISIDERGTIQTLNPATETIFGYTADELVGRNVKVLMPEPYRSEHDGYVANYLRTGQAKVIGIGREVQGRRKDGSVFPLDLAISEFHLGERRFFTGIVRDITERKRAEQDFRFLAEASSTVAALIDYDSTLQKVAGFAVPTFADWCAVDLVDETGRLCPVALVHAHPDQVKTGFDPAGDSQRPAAPFGARRVLETGQSVLLSNLSDGLLPTVAGGDERLQLLRELDPKSYICVPLTSRGHSIGVMTFITGRSGRRYDEKDLALAEELARRWAIAIENARLYRALRETDQRKDEFLAMLAHELRNPLAPIRSGLDLLNLTGAEADVIGPMQQQVEHLVRLVDDLLDVSRIMRGKAELRREPVDVASLVGRAVETVRPVVDAQGLRLSVSLPPKPVWLDADPVRLAQVIANLLNNSAKYTESAGQVWLTARQEGNEMVLRVRDTGIGIDPHLLPHVFDLFTQSERTMDRSQGGLGIGLTIVKSLVEMHGGSVSAHSEGPGKGSEFILRLPVAQPVASPLDTRTSPPATRHYRILVVDDNVAAAKMLRLLLVKLGGHEVTLAFDGEEALQRAMADQPDLILLDIGLPKMNGYEVAQRLRQRPEFQQTLLVALTGYGTDEDRRKTQEAGFDEHLVKPPPLARLHALFDHPKLTSQTTRTRPA